MTYQLLQNYINAFNNEVLGNFMNVVTYIVYYGIIELFIYRLSFLK